MPKKKTVKSKNNPVKKSVKKRAKKHSVKKLSPKVYTPFTKNLMPPTSKPTYSNTNLIKPKKTITRRRHYNKIKRPS
tara:strand:- start:188 stop:418 length:231 start_codon:yes stop_codon:yes gene_type:complete